MNIKQIKNRAEDLLKDCKPQVIRILVIMLLLGAIPSLVDYDNALFSIISFVLLILYVPFSHGQIVTALKVVRNTKETLNDEDALVGFSRFKELFFTYFLTGLLVTAVALVIVMIGMVFFVAAFGSIITNLSSIYGFAGSIDISSLADLVSILGVYGPVIVMAFLLLFLFVTLVMVILSLYLYAVPYLLEQYNLKGMDAIKESFSFIKGNVWNLFKLQFSFVGWIILFAIIEGILSALLTFIPVLGTVIASLAAGALAIYVYMPNYITSMAIFFEEIAYYRYNSNQQGETLDE